MSTVGETDPEEATVDEKRTPERAAEETAVERLRAADPAAGAEPDLASLRVVVDARRAGAPDQLAARRLRRLTSWPARAAAVAAAALVVGGGGGYVLGASGGTGDSGGETAAAELTADAPIVLGVPGAEMAEEAEGGFGADSGGFAPEVQAGDGRMLGDAAYWPGWYGRTVFRETGLSTTGATGRGWALDASGVTAEAAARMAAALGVDGEPRLEYGAWTVGPNDGSGATVSLSADGSASLSYWNPANDVAYCEVAPMPGIEPVPDEGSDDGGTGSGAGGGTSDAPAAPRGCEDDDAGDAPQGAAAEAVLRDLMSAVGVDPAGYQVVAGETSDDAYSWVSAYQVIDGQQTGLTWSLGLTGKGATSLYGVTASLVDLGEYDVVSPAEAVQRLNDPRFGAGWAGPVLMGARGVETDVAPAPEEPDGEPPAPARPGSAFAWPVREVTIVEARLGVAVATTRDGATVLAPSYALTADDGSVWSVIAVAETHLDFATD